MQAQLASSAHTPYAMRPPSLPPTFPSPPQKDLGDFEDPDDGFKIEDN